MTDTEIFEEQHNTASLINAFHKAKLNLAALKAVRKDYENKEIRTEEYLALRNQVKALQKDLKEMKEDALETLKEDEAYNNLRGKQMEYEEELTHQRETVAVALEKLPPKMTQMRIPLDGEGEANIQITSHKKLFINGKDQKI